MDDARKNPGIKYGHAGVGYFGFYKIESLNRLAKLNMTHVPFNGNVAAFQALLGKHLLVAILDTGFARPHIEPQACFFGKALARPKAKHLLEDIEDMISFAGRDKWPKISPLLNWPPCDVNTGKVVIRELDIGIALRILEVDIVAWLMVLDEVIFKNKRFDLIVCHHDVN
jgi:hypothetical protein